MFSDGSSAHHQEFRPDPARKLSAKPVWHITLLCVQGEKRLMMERGTVRNM